MEEIIAMAHVFTTILFDYSWNTYFHIVLYMFEYFLFLTFSWLNLLKMYQR